MNLRIDKLTPDEITFLETHGDEVKVRDVENKPFVLEFEFPDGKRKLVSARQLVEIELAKLKKE